MTQHITPEFHSNLVGGSTGKVCPQHVELGWGAPPVSEQFDGFMSVSDATQFDKDKDAISQLRLRGYMTDSAHKAVVAKFIRAVAKALIKYRDRV